MKQLQQLDVQQWLLPLRLALMRGGQAPLIAGVFILCLLGASGWGWVFQQRTALRQMVVKPLSAPPVLAVAPPPASAEQNLAVFYDTLGEKRYAEQQVKTLFDLAAKSGLSLSQGEYKSAYDKASRVSTYQVVLPVKGSYQALWSFGLQALRAVPFASLDELAFRREQIADTSLEARLRLTFYLKDGLPPAAGAQP
ncbi:MULTISPECIES: hypothetical protein [unclassified Janthinobacterium]|uniref:hypothetical protein n=1 Tax=unclassified Janthinobacterium TaxID=2610881 RepID=UPI0016178537|nr:MULTISPECIES: hypothetical protein [unclassified Janthinobacterium]MBB5369744.1 hypothetical protein [Janthinobacterium sp. K2C7]MBB5382300.1 hypothetical protein [Janthinobacterium sp. K2Li3]MBB5387877.1 hypothetical protein [Janthinobacterium sp. K2E3]